MELSKRSYIQIASEEDCVLEAYRDSVGVWTAFFGLTNASGHQVYPRYYRNPQPMERAVELFVWAMERYKDEVLEAFKGFTLTENQLAGACSFNWNTGAIRRASWVELWKEGDIDRARNDPRVGFMAWDNPSSIVERRTREADLFFDNIWKSNPRVNLIPVNENSYPIFSQGVPVDISDDLDAVLKADPVEDRRETIAQVFERTGADSIHKREGEHLLIYHRNGVANET